MKNIICFLGFILWIAVSITIIVPLWMAVIGVDWTGIGKQLIVGMQS
jgi:hypothetical protein